MLNTVCSSHDPFICALGQYYLELSIYEYQFDKLIYYKHYFIKVKRKIKLDQNFRSSLINAKAS